MNNAQSNLRNVASLANKILDDSELPAVFEQVDERKLHLIIDGKTTILVVITQLQNNNVIVDVGNGLGACIWNIENTSDGLDITPSGFDSKLWHWQQGVMELVDVTKVTHPEDMILWEMENYPDLTDTVLAEFLADVVAGMSML